MAADVSAVAALVVALATGDFHLVAACAGLAVAGWGGYQLARRWGQPLRAPLVVAVASLGIGLAVVVSAGVDRALRPADPRPAADGSTPRNGEAARGGEAAPGGGSAPGGESARPEPAGTGPAGARATPSTRPGSGRLLFDGEVALRRGTGVDLDGGQREGRPGGGPAGGVDAFWETANLMSSSPRGGFVRYEGQPGDAEAGCADAVRGGAGMERQILPVQHFQYCVLTSDGNVGWLAVTGDAASSLTNKVLTVEVRLWAAG